MTSLYWQITYSDTKSLITVTNEEVEKMLRDLKTEKALDLDYLRKEYLVVDIPLAVQILMIIFQCSLDVGQPIQSSFSKKKPAVQTAQLCWALIICVHFMQMLKPVTLSNIEHHLEHISIYINAILAIVITVHDIMKMNDSSNIFQRVCYNTTWSANN